MEVAVLIRAMFLVAVWTAKRGKADVLQKMEAVAQVTAVAPEVPMVKEEAGAIPVARVILVVVVVP